MTPFISAGVLATSTAALSLSLSDIIVASRSAVHDGVVCNAVRIAHQGPLSTVPDPAFWSALSGEPQTAADVAEIRANLSNLGRILASALEERMRKLNA